LPSWHCFGEYLFLHLSPLRDLWLLRITKKCPVAEWYCHKLQKRFQQAMFTIFCKNLKLESRSSFIWALPSN
jgi:hypothetical protein